MTRNLKNLLRDGPVGSAQRVRIALYIFYNTFTETAIDLGKYDEVDFEVVGIGRNPPDASEWAIIIIGTLGNGGLTIC